MADPLLIVDGLVVDITTARGVLHAVRGVSLELARGETLCIVGESGCGKSMTALALMGLLPDGARVGGSVELDGRELVGLSEGALCGIRGRRIGMVFQEPMTALNPLHTVGHQIAERLMCELGLAAAPRVAGAYVDLPATA